ncbi:Hypothetical predicted protein [Pelobates cultripes]|uniref:Uncharacterized protein n=1 Tax=Pelobates cultripes TaxID=61616 RepID=A0AAD1RD31_PELCU|nr:Hypothetical predicted protein [Pelobates cultripes]
MGKHSRKSLGPNGGQTRDIGLTLSEPSRPKMADMLPDSPHGSMSSILGLTHLMGACLPFSVSEDRDFDPEEFLTRTRGGKAFSQRQPDPQWATKTDSTTMVTDLKASEMRSLKTDLSTLTGRIKATEEEVQSLGLKQASTNTHRQEVLIVQR